MRKVIVCRFGVVLLLGMFFYGLFDERKTGAGIKDRR